MQSDSKSLTQPCCVSLQGSDSEKITVFFFSFFVNCLLFCLLVFFLEEHDCIELSYFRLDLCLHAGLMQQGVVSQSPEYMHKQYLLVNN